MTAHPDVQRGPVQLQARLLQLAPGVVVCLVVAAAARFLSEHYAAPQMLFALLIGMALHFLAENEDCRPGLEFCARTVLRVGVALLGLRVTLDQIAGLGWFSVLWVAAGVCLTIVSGFLLGRLFRLGGQFGGLSGGAVAICGASAALAIASVLPEGRSRERDTIFVVVTVTTMSTLAMIVYPILAAALGLSAHQTGIFLGGTIHDVAQVVGAGYSVSPEVGDAATITKLFRVSLLAPVVVLFGVAHARRNGGAGRATAVSRLPVPVFVLAFAALMLVNSAGLVSAPVKEPLIGLSNWLLVAAISALGIKTSLKALLDVGILPVLLVALETVLLAAWVLVGELTLN